uniref:Uncharacterized protein n=1 Tax=Romanomermis culicivorax TaxID=13658 RepID=A0A915KPH1_ROMCU
MYGFLFCSCISLYYFSLSNCVEYWHNVEECQRVCFGMDNAQPFSKIVAYKHCMHGRWAVIRIERQDKIVCLTTVIVGSPLVIFNDYRICRNSNQALGVTTPNERYPKSGVIKVRCAAECAINCSISYAKLNDRGIKDRLKTYLDDGEPVKVKHGILCDHDRQPLQPGAY